MGLSNPLAETLKRIKIYQNSGADGIFVPCIENKSEIKEVVKSTHLPVNVMTMPKLPDFKTLADLGVKRISMGPFVYNNLAEKFEQSISNIIQKQSFDCLFQ